MTEIQSPKQDATARRRRMQLVSAIRISDLGTANGHRLVIVVCAALAVGSAWPNCAHAKWVWTKETGWVEPARLPSGTPEERFRLARVLMAEKQYASAVAELQELIVKYPNSPIVQSAMLEITEALFLEGSYAKAFEAVEQFLQKYPGSERARDAIQREYAIGCNLMATDPEKAVTVFEKVIKHQPFGPLADDAHVKIGDCYAKQMDYAGAVLAYEKAIREFPESEWAMMAHYRIGECNLLRAKTTANQTGPLAAARDGFDRYIRKYPDGKHAVEARERLTEVTLLQANKEMEVAEFYLRIKKPKAAAHCFGLITQEFAGTEAAENAREGIKYLKGIGALRP